MVYHGAAARKATAREMARQDIIITTYGVILSGRRRGNSSKLVPHFLIFFLEGGGHANIISMLKIDRVFIFLFAPKILGKFDK